MNDLNIHVGIIIRRLREEQNISQETLAFAANIDRTFISQVERGLKGISVNTLYKITNALNIDIIDFFKLVKNESDTNSI